MKNIQNELANIRKGNYAPIYLVLGEERYFIERIRETIIEHALDEESIDLNFSSFDMEENTINDALFEASSFPFFGERKVVFVQNPYFLTGQKVRNAPDHNIDELEDYLKNPADFTIFVIFAPYEKLDRRKKITKSLEKNAQLIDVSSPNANEANRYIKEVVKEKGYQFTDGAFQLFTERTDGNLTQMMHELDKIFLYHIDSKNITKDSIQHLVPKSLEQNVFELNTLVLNNQVEASVEAYHDLLVQKEEPIKIVALLISQFRLLLQVKVLQRQGYPQGDIAKVLKVHPYRVKLALQNVRRYEQHLLSEALDYLIDADYKMKTGQIDQELQVELFIMRFAQQSKVHA
ncbi:MAG TPA: DNA polymerase III subunit delta [Atopostipes sp.]|nr:DNA polymerase III subunit delta [Atopostipes sp.]